MASHPQPEQHRPLSSSDYISPLSQSQQSTTSERRSDGRSGGGSLRPLSCELSCLHRADGSALWKSGNGTQVMAAVYGPVAPKHSRHEQPTAVVSVILKGNANVTTTTTTTAAGSNLASAFAEWEDVMTQWLTAAIVVQEYPRSVIQIVLHIIQADGSVLSAAFHAAIAALLDAGVAMKYLPVATTICSFPTNTNNTTTTTKKRTPNASNRVLLLDPTAEEEMEEEATTWVIVTDPRQSATSSSNSKELSTNATWLGSCTIRVGSSNNISSSSFLSLEVLQQSIQIALKASPAVMAFWRLAVEQKSNREAQTLWSST